MKRGTRKILALLLVLASLFAVSLAGSAQGYEFFGGALYTTLELTDLNDAIADFNDSIDDLQTEGVSISDMDYIKDAFGAHGGTRLYTGRGVGLETSFETFSAGTGTEIKIEDSSNGLSGSLEVDFDVNLSVNGLVGALNAGINEFIGLTGGGGYYFGTATMSAKVDATGDYASYIEDQDFSESENVSGFGFKVGGYFRYPFSRNASLFSAVNYRLLELSAQNGNSLSSGGTGLNTNGIELKIGISFSA